MAKVVWGGGGGGALPGSRKPGEYELQASILSECLPGL